MRTCALAAALTIVSFNAALAQTNASNASAVGTWKLDAAKSDLGPQEPPKSVTLTILKDTPQAESWRVELVMEDGNQVSYSWTGPQDGSLQPLKGSDGQVLGHAGQKRDKDGALLRHGTDSSGASFETRATLSPDGNTITDVLKGKMPDGTTMTQTMIYHRVVTK